MNPEQIEKIIEDHHKGNQAGLDLASRGDPGQVQLSS